jgi:hypothetical protein
MDDGALCYLLHDVFVTVLIVIIMMKLKDGWYKAWRVN